MSDILSGYNATQSRSIFLNYEIEEVKKPSLISKSILESESNRINFWNSGSESRANNPNIKQKEVITLQQNQGMQIEEEAKKENIGLPIKSEGPYTAMKFFESARRSSSKSLDEPSKDAVPVNGPNVESKSNNNSLFSFNDNKNNTNVEKPNESMKIEPEKSMNVNSNKSFRSKNDNSVEVIYSLLNRQFPEQSTFVSKLTEDGYSPSKLVNINKIQIKKKSAATFEGLDDGKSSFSEGKSVADQTNTKPDSLASKQSQPNKSEEK